MRLARAPIALVWAIWLLILLLELATPPSVVLGILYVVPLLLGASQRSPGQAWRFVLLCCSSTLLNLLVPLPVAQEVLSVLIDRLLVCLSLVVITALLVRNRELEQQRIAMEVELAQAQLRGDVIATLAHDIKTPVLGTLASLSLLGSGGAVEAIRSSQQRCLRLIDDLLQVFRAEQEGLRVQLQCCNLLAIAQEAIRTVAPIAAPRQISLVLRQQGSGGMELQADPSLLQRLIENLLLNAVHHSLRAQRVWLQLSQRDGTCRIDVRDGGQGFPPEQLPQLFQRFGQRGSGTPGAGLGLYLCRLITEAHGGRIQASNLSGGGARVVVELPQQECS
ncbi:MAG: HAMP domain-containing histidine kinase [Cyanobacteria bacterium REEB417]|nr:HAMP domain-containing histidine kinase [Cyanobacteria bacterium REEB417]